MTSTEASRQDESLPRALAVLVVVFALLAQAALLVRSQRGALRQVRSLAAEARADDVASISLLPLTAYGDLQALEPLVAPDARVLLVTGVAVPVAYDFHLLPRPLHVLFAVDKLPPLPAVLPAAVAVQMRDWIARLDERGQRLDAQRLREWLARSDCLITVRLEAEALPWPEGVSPPRLLGRHGVTAVYELGRD